MWRCVCDAVWHSGARRVTRCVALPTLTHATRTRRPGLSTVAAAVTSCVQVAQFQRSAEEEEELGEEAGRLLLSWVRADPRACAPAPCTRAQGRNMQRTLSVCHGERPKPLLMHLYGYSLEQCRVNGAEPGGLFNNRGSAEAPGCPSWPAPTQPAPNITSGHSSTRAWQTAAATGAAEKGLSRRVKQGGRTELGVPHRPAHFAAVTPLCI